MSEEATQSPLDPCPRCGEKLIKVKLFSREWMECPNSVLEFFDGMRRTPEEKANRLYRGPTHFEDDVKP